jgi:hypothetical protein
MGTPTLVGRSSSVVFGTTSGVTPGSVAGVAEGDVAFIYMVAKRSTAALCQTTPNQPGWTSAASSMTLVGTGSAGAGTGPLTVIVYAKEADASGLGTLPAIAPLSGSCTGVVMEVWRPASGEKIAWAWVTGSDTTSATSWSVTGNRNPGLIADDRVTILSALTAAATGTFNSFSLAATGATIGSVSEAFDISTANGNDETFGLHNCSVTAGTATAAPVFTATLGTANTGGSGIVRIRSIPQPGLKNLCPNPAAAVNTTGWSTSGTLSAVSSLTGAPRTTGVQGTPANGGNLRTPRAAVTPGTTYCISVYTRVQAAVSLNKRINWYNSGGGLVSSSTQVQNLYQPTNWVRDWEIGTAPGTAATVELEVSPAGTVTWVQMTACMADAVDHLVPYADGSFSGWSWDGTADASTSQYPSGPVTHEAAADLAGEGALSAAGAAEAIAAATLAGAGSLAAGAVREQPAAATLAGAGLLSATATVETGAVTHEGAVALAGEGALSATAEVISYSHTGWLYAGSATEIDGTWVDEPNAVGPSTGDYATWTDGGAGTSAVLELASFAAQTGIPAGSTIGPVDVLVRHAENPAGDIASVTAQAYIGTTAHGDPIPLTVDAAVHEDTIQVADLDHADLADLRIQITASRA